MATTSDLKNGIIINFNNDLHSVVSVEHRTPGNLRAFFRSNFEISRTERQLKTVSGQRGDSNRKT